MKEHQYRTCIRNKLLRGGMVGFCILNLTTTLWADWTSGSNGTWRFIIMGDHRSPTTFNATLDGYVGGGVNVAAVADLAKAARAEGAVFVLNVGDLGAKFDAKLINVPGATAQEKAANLLRAELDLWLQTWNENSGALPVFPVRGNHENSAPASMWADWIKTVPGIADMTMYSPTGEEGFTYAFSYKNCLFVGLDVFPAGYTKLPALSANTMTWLNDLLVASDRPQVFVYGHTPAYEVWDTEKSGWARDGLASPRPKTLPSTPILVDPEAIANVRNPFWNLLGSKKGNYYCGHDHLYLRGVAPDVNGNPVMQVIMGNGGAPAYPQYPNDPFVESSATQLDNFGSPRITKLFMDQDGSLGKISYGYLLVEVHGSHATATYKVENQLGGNFKVKDTWTWKITDEDEDEAETAVLAE